MAGSSTHLFHRWLDENADLQSKLSIANAQISSFKDQLEEAQTQLVEAEAALIEYRIQCSPEGGKQRGTKVKELEDENNRLHKKIEDQKETIKQIKKSNKKKDKDIKEERRRNAELKRQIAENAEKMRPLPNEEIKRLHKIIESQNDMLRRECQLKGKLAKKLSQNGIKF